MPAAPRKTTNLLNALHQSLGERPSMRGSLHWAKCNLGSLSTMAHTIDNAIVTTNQVERVPITDEMRRSLPDRYEHAAMIGIWVVPLELRNLWELDPTLHPPIPRIWTEDSNEVSSEIVTALGEVNQLIARGEAFARGDRSVEGDDRMDFPTNRRLPLDIRLTGVLLNVVGAAAGPVAERAGPADRLIEAGTMLNPETQRFFIQHLGATGLDWLGASQAFSPEFVAQVGQAIDVLPNGGFLTIPLENPPH